MLCPFLFGRLRFEPWLCFDDHVRSTARVLNDTIRNDTSALRQVQGELKRLWKKAHGQVLDTEFTTSRFFPTVFPLVCSVLRAADPEAPSLVCSNRAILPRSAVRQPQMLASYNCVSVESQDLPCLSITSFTPGFCAYQFLLESQPSCGARDLSNQWNSLFAQCPEYASKLIMKQHVSVL